MELTLPDPSSMVPKPIRQMALKEAESVRKLQLPNTSADALKEPEREQNWWKKKWIPKEEGKGKDGKGKKK